MAQHRIQINITADNAEAIRRLEELQRDLQDLGNNDGPQRAAKGMEKLTSAIGSVKAALAGAFAVGTIAEIGKSALKAAADMEVLQKGLTFQVGNQEMQKLVASMQKLGEESAFSGSALIPMARKWINVGASADEAIGQMRMIVDAASAFGLTENQIGLCTDALTKMASEGRVNAEDMNALNDDGIPAWQLLSEAMGKPVAELREMSSKGQLAQDAINALYDGIEKRTKGATENMNGTLKAAFANLEEMAGNSLVGIGNILDSVFDVRGTISKLGDMVQIFRGYVESINTTIANGGNPITAILDEITNISPLAGSVANTVVAAFTSVKQIFDDLKTTIQENATLLGNIAVFAGTMYASYTILTAVAGAWAAVTSGEALATAGMYAFGAAQRLVNALALVNPYTALFAAIVAGIALVVTNWDSIKEAASAAFDSVSQTVSDFVAGLEEAWTSVVESVESVWSALADWFSDLWDSVTDIVSEAWDAIGEIISDYFDVVTAVWSPIIDYFQSVWASVSDVVLAAWNYISELASEALDYLEGLWQGVADWFESTVWSPVANFADDCCNSIKEFFQSAYDYIVGVFGGLASWFADNVVNPIKEMWNSLPGMNGDFSLTSGNSSPVNPSQNKASEGKRYRFKSTPSGGGSASKGGGGSGGGRSSADNAAEKAAKAQEKAQKKAEDLYEDMQKFFATHKGTEYQKKQAEIAGKVKDKNQKIDELAAAGANADLIQKLRQQVTEYQQLLSTDVVKKHKEAMTEFNLLAQEAFAKSTKDYAAQADIKYAITKNQLAREREEKEKELMLDENDTATKEAIAAEYYAKLQQAENERLKAHEKVHSKIISDMQKEGNVAGILADYRVNKDKWASEQQKASLQSLADFTQKNLQMLSKSWQDNIIDSLDEVQNEMGNMISDFITGTKSASEAFSDFAGNILNMMAKIAAQKLAASWMEGLSGWLHFSGGGKVEGHASGGYISGPGTGKSDSIPAWLSNGEYVMTAQATKMYAPILEAMNAGKFAAGGLAAPKAPRVSGIEAPASYTNNKGGNVVVNVTNNTGSEIKAEQTSSQWDGEQWVVGVVLNAVATNRNGIRNMIKGVAAT